ncbi:MAG TPA: hypothetical protein VMU89_13085 [Thermomicrobiaceae bacterium]|nr:hypothetical protein [Thermomicrobiaceae bacterium]
MVDGVAITGDPAVDVGRGGGEATAVTCGPAAIVEAVCPTPNAVPQAAVSRRRAASRRERRTADRTP